MGPASSDGALPTSPSVQMDNEAIPDCQLHRVIHVLLCRIERFGVAVLNLDEYGHPDMLAPSENACPEHTCSPVKGKKEVETFHQQEGAPPAQTSNKRACSQ